MCVILSLGSVDSFPMWVEIFLLLFCHINMDYILELLNIIFCDSGSWLNCMENAGIFLF